MSTIPIIPVTVEELIAEKEALEKTAGLTFEELSERTHTDLSRDQVDILFRLEGLVEMLRLEQ